MPEPHGGKRRCSTQDLGKIWYLKSRFPVVFMAFDILEWNGDDLTNLPYSCRKDILLDWLESITSCSGKTENSEHIRFAEHSESPRQLFEDVVSRGGEGVILKRLNSRYIEGYRSYDWLKVKLEQRAVCDVVGWTEGNNRRSESFGSLVLMQNGKYVGNVGGGFTDYELTEIADHLKSCPRMKPPFLIDEPYTAVKTDMKVLVRYHRRTETGVFRFPVFIRRVS